jgi:hypothetical protein
MTDQALDEAQKALDELTPMPSERLAARVKTLEAENKRLQEDCAKLREMVDIARGLGPSVLNRVAGAPNNFEAHEFKMLVVGGIQKAVQQHMRQGTFPARIHDVKLLEGGRWRRITFQCPTSPLEEEFDRILANKGMNPDGTWMHGRVG